MDGAAADVDGQACDAGGPSRRPDLPRVRLTDARRNRSGHAGGLSACPAALRVAVGSVLRERLLTRRASKIGFVALLLVAKWAIPSVAAQSDTMVDRGG